MPRIASAILIVVAVLVLNAGMSRNAFAAAHPPRPQPPRIEIVQPQQVRSGKVLGVLLVLDSLRLSRISLDGQKV